MLSIFARLFANPLDYHPAVWLIAAIPFLLVIAIAHDAIDAVKAWRNRSGWVHPVTRKHYTSLWSAKRSMQMAYGGDVRPFLHEMVTKARWDGMLSGDQRALEASTLEQRRIVKCERISDLTGENFWTVYHRDLRLPA